VSRPFALVAEFAEEAPLRRALKRLRIGGYKRVEIYSPYPLAGIDTEPHPRALPLVVFGGAVLGLVAGYGTEVWLAAVDYKVNVGGRPLHSLPAFVPIAFEIMVLVAVAAAAAATIALAGLPRLHHPISAAPGFERASQDRFFLAIETEDPRFDQERLEWLLEHYQPVSVTLVTE
jgi:hypothetical protein